jgi:hypothetical protein
LESRRTNWRALTAGLLFLLTLAVLPIGLALTGTGALWFRMLLFFSGALAGASGATIRTLWTNAAEDSMPRTLVLGLAAGGVSAVLYLVAQFAASPVLGGTAASGGPQPNALLLFAVMIGFIAGFTFDTVYKKLALADVAQTGVVSAKKVATSSRVSP